MREYYPIYLPEEDTNEIVYIFDSEIHGEYYIKFMPAKHRFTDGCDVCSMVYEVMFTPFAPKDSKKGEDPRIRQTVFFAIRFFMEKFLCPILYVCDTMDARHECRSKLFEKWFLMVDQNLYEHKSQRIESFGQLMIVGIIGEKSDPYLDTYLNELYTYTDSIE